MRFAGKRVLITGAASGLGAATASAFAAEGAELVLVDLNAEGLGRVATATGGQALAGDVTEPGLAEKAVCYPVDILFHAAGIDPHDAAGVPETSLAVWDRVLAVNLTSAFLFARAVLPGMIARRQGVLLFTASVSGLSPTPCEVAYSVSKAGLIQLAKAIALDNAHEGLRANAIAPGMLEAVMSDRRRAMDETSLLARRKAAETLIPLGREGHYEEIAQLALAICDDKISGYITGQVITADGGYMLAHGR